MNYTKDERVFMVKKFSELKSPIKVQRAWRAHFRTKTAPDAHVIKYNVSKLQYTGSVMHTPRRVRVRGKKVNNAKIHLKRLVSAKPTYSTRKAAKAIGISHTSVHKVLREDLHLKPYKYKEGHELHAGDPAKRVKFAKWLLSLPKDASKFMICTDEAYFYFTKSLNKQNDVMWLESKPTD